VKGEAENGISRVSNTSMEINGYTNLFGSHS